jgi:hypothetical protein
MSGKKYPYWEKGKINWRLYIAPGMFGAGKTKEKAYKRMKVIVSECKKFILEQDVQFPGSLLDALEL